MNVLGHWSDLYRISAAGHDMRACNCRGPQCGQPVCPCLMPDFLRRQEMERQRAQRQESMVLRPAKPRIRVKAKSRPSTPEARNG
jgi:hypothetical protein